MVIKILKLAGGAIMGYARDSVQVIDKLPNGVYEVEILTEIPKKGRRSTLQNAYYWGCVLAQMVREVDDSYNAEQFHDMLKGQFFGYTAIGKGHIINGSTAKLDTTEMEEYLVMCREWARDNLNLYIQLPNESGFNY